MTRQPAHSTWVRTPPPCSLLGEVAVAVLTSPLLWLSLIVAILVVVIPTLLMARADVAVAVAVLLASVVLVAFKSSSCLFEKFLLGFNQ